GGRSSKSGDATRIGAELRCPGCAPRQHHRAEYRRKRRRAVHGLLSIRWSLSAHVARFPAAVAEVDDAPVDVPVIGVARVLEPAQMLRHAPLLRITRHAHAIVGTTVRVAHQRDAAYRLRHGMAPRQSTALATTVGIMTERMMVSFRLSGRS